MDLVSAKLAGHCVGRPNRSSCRIYDRDLPNSFTGSTFWNVGFLLCGGCGGGMNVIRNPAKMWIIFGACATSGHRVLNRCVFVYAHFTIESMVTSPCPLRS